MRTISSFVSCAVLACLTLAASAARATEIPDGTIIHVRLVSPITSEDAKAGSSVAFVVTRDVVVDGAVVIARKTPAVATIVAARRATWGFIWHRAVLSFAFIETTAVDGQSIHLRASNASGEVNIDRSDYHHDLQWATEGDTFQAAVAGNYALRLN
jgi:hypothetical protein